MVEGDEFMAKVEDCPGFETFGADVKAPVKSWECPAESLRRKSGLIPGIWRTSN